MIERCRRAGWVLFWSALVLSSGGFHASASAAEIELVLEGNPSQPALAAVVVRGLPAEVLQELRSWGSRENRWREWLAVYTAEASQSGPGKPAMLGQYEIDGVKLRFRPRFPLKAGLTYSATFDGNKLRSLVGSSGPPMPVFESSFRVPEPVAGTQTRVLGVFPSAQHVPENLLRIYVHFSAPMQAKDVHRHIRLVDAAGLNVELPFVEVEKGLWDPRRQRLTLFFHPGRIKRGVGPNMAMGPPLRRGEQYRLIVDQSFPDSNGFPLQQSFEKAIAVGEADRSSPDPTAWHVSPPGTAGGPLVIEFPEPLDEALLRRLLRVENSLGEPVVGSIEVDREETRWSFRPADPWLPGGYSVWIHPALEDLAGNRIDGLFETDGPVSKETEPVLPVEIAFWLDF